MFDFRRMIPSWNRCTIFRIVFSAALLKKWLKIISLFDYLFTKAGRGQMKVKHASVEMVLNSRCSSDAGVTKSHFGTFVNKYPSDTTTDRILKCLAIPRFSDGQLRHWSEDGFLFLGFKNPNDPKTQRLLHIESGMQHEAVYLACAAEGVGTCIHNKGINGTQTGDDIVTATHLIMEIEDPYDSGKLTSKAPGPQKPHISGRNLTDPTRESDIECLPELSNLATFKKSGTSVTEKGVSQLLWAAKGRTPHCIKVNRWNFMWGLTIPTWGGGQNYTSVYLAKDKTLYSYVNWTKDFSFVNRFFREKFRWNRGTPTHDIRFLRKADISSHINGHETAIILCQSEYTARALWEVGYMLENMFLQAKSLGISYESLVFSEDQASQLHALGLANAVAAVLI